jgi:Flp pilus assembly protein TadD
VERLVVPTEAAADKKAGEEFTKKLISLGYLTGAEASAVDARPPDRAGTETAGALQNVATFLRARGKVKESLAWYRRALEVNPKSPTAWMNLSLALESLAKWDESDESLIQAVKFGYNDPEAAVYRRVAGYLNRAKKDPNARTQLVTYLKRVVDAFPDNHRYRASLGKVLFENKDCAGAETVFRDLVAKRPGDVESLNVLALAMLCLGRPDEARTYFEKSLALDPNQEIVRQGLAQLGRGGKSSP